MKYTKEKIEEIVNESKSFSDVTKKFGLNHQYYGNRQTIKKYIELYKIDISHFGDYNKSNRFNKKIELSDILIKDSKYINNVALKNRLYKIGLKKRNCELCDQGEEWKGKKMSLILDHINGTHNDNRIENLRIVCPNCNSTLDTHCGKNNSLKNLKKIKYGILINDNVDFRKIQTIEKINSQIKRRKVIRPEYEILLIDVKELGYKGTGRKYSVSDNCIRKWVKNYEKDI